MIEILAIVLVVALAAVLLRVLFRSKVSDDQEGHTGSYLVELVRCCHGDEELAFRLLQAQKKRARYLSDEQAARRAITALKRDQR